MSPTDPDSMVFPHLYGPLPAAAVISVTSYRPDANGRFAPPGAQVAHVGVDLDLHQQLGRDERRHLHHRRDRTDVAEHLGVHRADVAPQRDVGDDTSGSAPRRTATRRPPVAQSRCGAMHPEPVRRCPRRRRWYLPPRHTDRCAPHASSRRWTRTPSPTTRCGDGSSLQISARLSHGDGSDSLH